MRSSAVALTAVACLMVRVGGTDGGTSPSTSPSEPGETAPLTVSEAVLNVLGENLDYAADMQAATEAVEAEFSEQFTPEIVYNIFSGKQQRLTEWQSTILEMKHQSTAWLKVALSQIGHRKLKEGKTDEALAHFQGVMRRAKHADSLDRLVSGSLAMVGEPWHLEGQSYNQMINLILGQKYMKGFVEKHAPTPKRDAGGNSDGGGGGADAATRREGKANAAPDCSVAGNCLHTDDDKSPSFTHHELREAEAIASARGELAIAGVDKEDAKVTASLYSEGNAPEALEVQGSGFVLHSYQRQLLRDLPQISPKCPPPDRVNANISAKELYEKYIYLNRPFVVEAGSAEHWPAAHRWTRKGLYTHYRDFELNVATRPLPTNVIADGDEPRWKGSPDVETMSMEDFLDKVMPSQLVPLEHGNLTHPDRRYVFNTVSGRVVNDFTDPELLSFAQSQNFFQKANGHPEGYVEWVLGPALSGSHMHAHLAAWNVIVSGRKRWVLAPYGEFKPAHQTLPAYHWFKDALPVLQAEETCRFMEFEQAAGELVYVPDHWFHAVLNLEPTVGASKQLGGSMWPETLPDEVFGR